MTANVAMTIDATALLQIVTMLLIGIIGWNVQRIFGTLDKLVNDFHDLETDVRVIQARLKVQRAADHDHLIHP